MLICVLVLRVAPSWAARWLGCRRRGRCCCAPSGTRRPSWTPSDSRLSSTRAPWSRRGRGATWSWETCTLSYSIRSALFELLHVEAVVHFFMVSYWYVCVCVLDQACREGELTQKLQEEQFCLLQCAVVEAEGIILDAVAKLDDPIHVCCISSPGETS